MELVPLTGKPMSSPPPQHAIVARIATSEKNARHLAQVIEELFDGVAVSALESETLGAWAVEIILSPGVDRDTIQDALQHELPQGTRFTFTPLAERDWVQTSLSGLNPVAAGRFFVHGSHDRRRVPPNASAIEVEAALAFGTGHHGTTRGCLLALDALLKKNRPRRVLDVGTGSGVLAIAAALALRTRIDATDIDLAAVRVSRDNAALNRVKTFVRVMPANGLPKSSRRYDLIFANILAGPLIGLSTGLARKLEPNGRIVLSGILAAQAHAVVAAYRARGLVLRRRIPLEGWVTLILRKKSRTKRKAPRA